jgi:hypothetical protein
LGNQEILSGPVLGFYAPRRCNGNVILGCYDLARALRDENITVMSFFQSPVECEVLEFLARGAQPIVILLPATAALAPRNSVEQKLLDDGRVVFIRPKSERGRKRDEGRMLGRLLAALSDALLVTHMDAEEGIFRESDVADIPTAIYAMEPIVGAEQLGRIGTGAARKLAAELGQRVAGR